MLREGRSVGRLGIEAERLSAYFFQFGLQQEAITNLLVPAVRFVIPVIVHAVRHV